MTVVPPLSSLSTVPFDSILFVFHARHEFRNLEVPELGYFKIYLRDLFHVEETLGERADGDVGAEILEVVPICLPNTALQRNLRISIFRETAFVEKPTLLIVREGTISSFLLHRSKINFIRPKILSFDYKQNYPSSFSSVSILIVPGPIPTTLDGM